MNYDLKGWTPPPGLMESFASGNNVAQSLATTQKSISAYFAKLGVPADKAAEAARTFTGELSKALAEGVPPGQAVAAAKADITVSADPVQDAPTQQLAAALARGENVQVAVGKAAGKGASQQHLDAFANTLQNAIAKGLDMGSALKLAEAGAKAVDAAKGAHDVEVTPGGALLAGLAGGGDAAKAALKAATAGMSPDQAGAFLQAFQAAAAGGADFGAALKLAGQAAEQQTAIAKAQDVPMSAADRMVAQLAGGNSGGLGKGAGTDALIQALSQGGSTQQAAQAGQQAADAHSRQTEAQGVAPSPSQALMNALATGTLGAGTIGGGKEFAQALANALAHGADLATATQTASQVTQAADAFVAAAQTPQSPAAQLAAALASGQGAGGALSNLANSAGGDAGAFANTLAAVLAAGGDIGSATRQASDAAQSASQQASSASEGVTADPTVQAMATGTNLQSLNSDAIVPVGSSAPQLQIASAPQLAAKGADPIAPQPVGPQVNLAPPPAEPITFSFSGPVTSTSSSTSTSTTDDTKAPVNEPPKPPPDYVYKLLVLSKGGSGLAYKEDDAATAVDGAISVSEDPYKSVTKATVKISGNYVLGEDVLSLTGGSLSGSFDAATGELTITGSGSASAYATALQHVAYRNTSQDPGTTARTLTYTVYDDRGGVSDTETVTVESVNDAPQFSATLGAKQVDEDTGLSLAGFAITDVDDEGQAMQVTLTAAHGTVTLGLTTGLTFQAGHGNGTASVVFTGTKAAINAALTDAVTYRGDLNYNGADSVDVTVSDQGNSGTGGAKTASSSVAVTVKPVNDAPTVTTTDSQPATVAEDGSMSFANLTVGDVEGDSLSVTVTALNGKVDGQDTLTQTGSAADVTTWLRSLSYAPTADYNGSSGGIRVQVSDTNAGDVYGPGGAKTTTATFAATVTSVNDAPTLVAKAPTLTTISNQDQTNQGMAVSDIIPTGSITENAWDNAVVKAMAVTAVDNAHGIWKYSTNDGVDWSAITLGAGQMLLLDSAARVRFMPASNYAGEASFTYKAWDKTSGTAGTVVDAATAGTSISAASDAASISVLGSPTGYPLNADFTSATDKWSTGGTAVMVGSNGRIASDHLRLTDAVGDQSGFALYSNPFPSAYGVDVKFKYYDGDGTKGHADGLSFFLVDGRAASITAGATGGGLGYVNVPNAYMGIGFDEYGNWLNSGSFNGGLKNGTSPDYIGIRGSQSTGYKYIDGSAVSLSGYGGVDGGQRDVEIIITANQHVTVKMNWGADWKTIINDLDFGTLNGATVPTSFKLGFAASTGGENNDHSIDDVNVSLLSSTVPSDLKVSFGGFATWAAGSTGHNYSVYVDNIGSYGDQNATFDYVVPAEFTNVRWSWTTNGGDHDSGTGNTIHQAGISLSPGERATFTITGDLAAGAGTSTSHSVTVTAGSGITDTNAANNTATVTETIAHTPAATVASQNALQLDGSHSATVTDVAALHPTDVVTVEAWVRVDSKAGYATIFDNLDAQNGYALRLDGSGDHACFAIAKSGTSFEVAGSKAVADGAWHHLAGSYDGTTMRLYVDGVADGTTGASNGLGASAIGPLIGTDAADASRSFTGAIADLDIWHSARSAAEVANDMTHQLTGSESALLAAFRLDEASGTALADAAHTTSATATAGTGHTSLDEFSVAHGGSYKGMVLGSDANDDTLSYALHPVAGNASGGALYGSVTMSGNTFSYAAGATAHDDSFQVDVSDGLSTTTHTVTVHVT